MSKRKAHGAEHFKKMVERKAMSVEKEAKSGGEQRKNCLYARNVPFAKRFAPCTLKWRNNVQKLS